LVVVVAAIATGLAGGHSVTNVIASFGKAFIDSRSVAVVWLALPIIGLLERSGLKERARTLIAGIRVATTGRLLLAYLVVRQITAALGLTSLGGQAQWCDRSSRRWPRPRPSRFGVLRDAMRFRIRANAAAVDNIGVFFGEDIFIAIGSILLIRGFLDQNGIHVQPTDLAIWAIPTAIFALIIHGTRLLLLDRSLVAEAKADA
jgi:uncharacterized membrane protein